MKLTSCSTTLLGKLLVESGSCLSGTVKFNLACPQQPANGFYPDAEESCLYGSPSLTYHACNSPPMIPILISKIQPTFSYATTLRLILIFFSHLYPGLCKGVLSSHLPTNIRYALLISPMHSACYAHPILFDLVTPRIFGEENK